MHIALACVAALLSPVTAAAVPHGVVAFPVHRINNLTAYGTELLLGTPPQKVVLEIDTGSPTYSATSPINPICKQGICSEFGTYNNLTSSTTKWINEGFNNILINHGYGSFVNDTLSIGGSTYPNMMFGVIEYYAAAFPITKPLPTVLGLGASCFTKACDDYPTLLQLLHDRGAVSRRTLSVYLGEEKANATGEIIFGGYDKAKRAGPVIKRHVLDPTTPEANNSPNRVPLSGINFSSSNGSHTAVAFPNNTYALWDTGSSAWYLPDPIFQGVAAALGFNATGSFPFKVDCKRLKPTSDVVTVEFGHGAKIEVPMHRLVTQSAHGHCFTTVNSGGDSVIFGDAFFRSVYVTFDYDKLTVEFSAVNYTEDRDIVKST